MGKISQALQPAGPLCLAINRRIQTGAIAAKDHRDDMGIARRCNRGKVRDRPGIQQPIEQGRVHRHALTGYDFIQPGITTGHGFRASGKLVLPGELGRHWRQYVATPDTP